MNSNLATRKSHVIIWSLLLISIGLPSGCGRGQEGPARASVSGDVSLDGQPLKEGVIRFIPDGETKGPQATVPIQEGRFEIRDKFGPVVGLHRIEIESTDDGGFAMDDEKAIEQLHKSGVKKIEVVKVPFVYNKRSQLKEEVTAEGPNEYTFELNSKAKR